MHHSNSRFRLSCAVYDHSKMVRFSGVWLRAGVDSPAQKCSSRGPWHAERLLFLWGCWWERAGSMSDFFLGWEKLTDSWPWSKRTCSCTSSLRHCCSSRMEGGRSKAALNSDSGHLAYLERFPRRITVGRRGGVSRIWGLPAQRPHAAPGDVLWLFLCRPADCAFTACGKDFSAPGRISWRFLLKGHKQQGSFSVSLFYEIILHIKGYDLDKQLHSTG